MIVSLSEAARFDLIRLRAFLATKNPRAASEAVRRIIDGIDSLKDFPDIGRPLPDGRRELILGFGRSAYIAQYVHLPAQHKVIVGRVFHGLEDRT